MFCGFKPTSTVRIQVGIDKGDEARVSHHEPRPGLQTNGKLVPVGSRRTGDIIIEQAIVIQL